MVWSGEAWVGETSSQSLIEGALGHVPWALIKLEFQFLADINILLMIRPTSMKHHNISNNYKFTATYSSDFRGPGVGALQLDHDKEPPHPQQN